MTGGDFPAWLLEKKEPDRSVSRGKTSGRRSSGFLDRTLHELAGVIREDVLAEKLAGRRGLLQGITPVVKVVTTIILIGVACALHHPVTLLALNLWVLFLARFSAIPLKPFLKRVWLVVPLFTVVLTFPSVFNIVRPGDPLLTLWQFTTPHRLGPWTLPDTLAITRQGVWGAMVLVLRVGSCVSLAALLTLTTRWQAILKALRLLHLPVVFTTVLEMTYRYIYVLLQAAEELFLARKSRTIGRFTTREGHRFVSGAMGALWTKAFNLSEEVHAAMLSRGYTGEPRTLDSLQTTNLDRLWGLFMILVGLLFIGGDRILG